MDKKKTYKQVLSEIKKDSKNTFSKNYILRKRWLIFALDFTTMNKIIEKKELKCDIYEAGDKTMFLIKKEDLISYITQHHKLYE